ncbi:serine/threonine-protein kinase [Geodermatophilus sabuli]|uniref:serine/threonine-protein kinase n=1 Tax=Geodermatophilus sabuli TaxID=1564158 RepID=UPI00160E28E8|nr:serine/threonine-protein kinase [Geodermatophilus sabuli]MBB3082147.1 serine/threonine-protein kinase [Geodermatophilus sabuli]
MTAFGPYELQGLLGRGGMGEVHRAYDREQARVVALKLLPAAMATDEGFVERFKRESYAAAQLNDPHVLPIHRYGEIEGRLYIDMRLVEGLDLAELIAREGPLPPVRAVSIVAQAAQALDAAHARRLVHRDVKPSNLLLTSQDFVYLVDFGIAQVGGSDARPLTADGAAVGTFDYMAPERLHGGAEVDGRADVYSLACVLHEALTGRRPFPVEGVPALVHAHLSTPPPRVTALRPDLPAGLDAVVARGMAKSPADRYATCGELAADAVRALQGAPPRVPVAVVPSAAPTVVPGAAAAVQAPPTYVPPAPPGTWPPAATQPPERRGRGTAGWLVAAAALVVAAVLAGVLLGQRGAGGNGAGAGTVATDSDAPPGAISSPDPPSEDTAEDAGQQSTPASRTASDAPSSPAPRTGPARGDLGLPVPISDPACDSSWVVFLGSAVTPGRYEEEISGFLAAHPGASYLLTAGSCSSLRHDLDGALIYAAYTGPFPSQAAACAERARVGGESYVKRLDDTTPPGQLWTC